MAAAPRPSAASPGSALALAEAERPGVAHECVRRPVELRRTAFRVAQDLERLPALPSRDGAEAIAVDALEDRGSPPRRRGAVTRLQVAFVPAEGELVALRPPATQDACELGRRRLTRSPGLDLRLGVERSRRELSGHGDRIEACRRVRQDDRSDTALLLHDKRRDGAHRAALVPGEDPVAEAPQHEAEPPPQ